MVKRTKKINLLNKESNKLKSLKNKMNNNKSFKIDLSQVNKTYNKIYNLLKIHFPKLNDDEKLKFISNYWFNHYDSKFYDFLKFIIYKNKKKINEVSKDYFIGFKHNKSSNFLCSNNYKIIKLLGEGAYGKTYLVETKNKKKYAIKYQTLNDYIPFDDTYELDDKKNKLKEINKEAVLMTQASKLGIGPKIYDKYYCSKDNNFNVFFVMEYLEGGTLADYLNNGNKLTELMKKEIKNKVKIMHKNGIYHQDLHENNLMLRLRKNKDPEIMIGDYGLSKNVEQMSKKLIEEDYFFINTIFNKSRFKEYKEIDYTHLAIKIMIVNKLVKYKL